MDKWELISRPGNASDQIGEDSDWVQRFPVPGGWLYRTSSWIVNDGVQTHESHVVFVPTLDNNHRRP